MVTFTRTMGGYDVRIGDNLFGHLDKKGFFLDPTTVRTFIHVNIEDFYEIIKKIEKECE